MLTIAKKTATVESITAGLGKMVSDLNDLADTHASNEDAKKAEAARLTAEAEQHAAERARSLSVASRIAALLS